MEALISKVEGDSTLMFLVAMAVVILLFIVLVVVVSAMRVKSYKDRFINAQIDNHAKQKQIDTLQERVEALNIQNAKDAQELAHFGQTKEKLEKSEKHLADVQNQRNELAKLQSQTQANLQNYKEMYTQLQEEHASMVKRYDEMQDDINKLRVNNARLLMKLETEAQFSSVLQQRKVKGDTK
jgi:uncharacterized protein (DUF3084 family)